MFANFWELWELQTTKNEQILKRTAGSGGEKGMQNTYASYTPLPTIAI